MSIRIAAIGAIGALIICSCNPPSGSSSGKVTEGNPAEASDDQGSDDAGSDDAVGGDEGSGGEAEGDTTPPTIDADSVTLTAVSPSELTVTWKAATDDKTSQDKIEYGALAAPNAYDISTPQELKAYVDSAPAGVVFLDFAANVTKATFKGLKEATTYHVLVVARDEVGNHAFYQPKSFKTAESHAPVPGDTITFSDITSSGATATWGAATDDKTPAEELLYKAVTADAIADIDTVEEAQAVPSANVLFDWTANKLSHALDGLGASQDVAVAVLVKDADGNVAIYPPQTFTTIAEAAITVGSAINATDVYGISMTVNWGAATSSSGDTLEYKVVKASSAAEIDTVDEADAAADIVLDWTEDTYSVEATELSPATTYVFAVLVRDSEGNMALYTPKSFTTASAKRILLTAATSDGAFLGEFSTGIEGADAFCESDANKPESGTYKAFIADGDHRRACVTEKCSGGNEGVDWVLKPNTTYVNASGEIVGTANANGIFDTIDKEVAASGSTYWTGMNQDWTTAGATTCLQWASSASNKYGAYGEAIAAVATTPHKSYSKCDAALSLLCVEQ